MKKYIILFLIIASTTIVFSGCGKKTNIPVTIDRTGTSQTEIYEDDGEEPLEIENTVSEVPAEQETTTPSDATPQTTESDASPTEEVISENSVETNEVTISFVKGIINTLMSSTSQEDIDSYLQSIATEEQFTFNPIVNQKTQVSIENIGVNNDNPNEYLGIVTLRQEGGISKFSVLITFKDTKLSSFTITKF